MSDEQDKLKVSLEPPRLFGRKKKPAARDAEEAAAPADAPVQPDEEAVEEAAAEETAPVEVAAAADPDEDLAEEPTDEQTEEPTAPIEAVAPAEPAQPVAPPAPDMDEQPTAVDLPVVDEPAEQEPEPTPVKKAAPAAKKAAPAATKPAPAPVPPKKPAPAPAKKSAPAAARPAAVTTSMPVEPAPVTDYEREDAEIAAMEEAPVLAPLPAAAVTGLVVGAAAVGLIWLLLRGCEAVRSTASCGGGPGFVLLVATFAVCVVLGSALLKLFWVKDPGTTSFLAAGVVAAVTLTFLVNLIDNWPIVIIVPVLAIAAYVGSVKLTEIIDETAP